MEAIERTVRQIMCGFRKLPVWHDARRLTLAAYQFTAGEGHTALQVATAAEVQSACVELLDTIQRAAETAGAGQEALKKAPGTIKRLARLLAEAHHQGLIGTLELALMMREAAAVKDALSVKTFLTAGVAS